MNGRGQSNLLAVVAALVALLTATTLGLALADAALVGAERPVEDRRVALALSERLVAPESPLTARANVLRAPALAGLTASRLVERFPVVGGAAVAVELGDETLVRHGDPAGGRTVRRVVLVQRRDNRTVVPALTAATGYEMTLPRRTPRAVLSVNPPSNATVTTVRANGRVVLHDPSGLDGRYEVTLSRYDTVTLSFDADGPLPRGSVAVTYFPARTTKAVLEVTVDAG